MKIVSTWTGTDGLGIQSQLLLESKKESGVYVMPLEMKDKVSLGVSFLSVAISLTTFGIVQHRESVDRKDKDARLLQSTYTLGERMEELREVSREIRRVTGSQYQSQLKTTREYKLIHTQEILSELKLNAQLDKFPPDFNEAVNFVQEQIRRLHGQRAAIAYDFGIRITGIFSRLQSLETGTESLKDCEKAQPRLGERVLANTNGSGPLVPDTCEWSFLSGFASMVLIPNDEIKSLGGPTEIARYPKTKDEAQAALGSALAALEDSWRR